MTGPQLTETYKTLSDGLYRIAFYILESQADAEDAVQDLFIKLWNTMERLDTVDNMNAYCSTLMKNLCIDRLRRQSHADKEPIAADIASTRQLEDNLLDREKLERVMAAIDGLPARQRDVLKMYVFEEMSYDEISKKTGMSNLNLRVLVSNARKSLRKLI